MKFEHIIEGLSKYIKSELYPAMNSWQKMIAEDVVERSISRSNALKAWIEENSIVRALGYVDADGNVDVDGIVRKLKEHISMHGKAELKIPMMPTYRFSVEDIDKLYRMMMEG